jgi:hypothetical protein
MSDKRSWGDVSIIGITETGMVSIEFYAPGIGDDEYLTIFLTLEQVKKISRLGVIIEDGKTA